MGKDLFDLASGISEDDIVDESVKLLPHNQKLYDDIVAQLKVGERSIFYSEGTGLGKSFVFIKLVQDYFKDARVLYIVPKIAIWNNVCHYKEFDCIADRVTLATFATFNKYPNNNVSCAEYDVVFVDECHHMLSDIQGKNVKQFLDDMVSWDKHVFGMTATPEIEGVFVDEECFDVSCYGLDMFEAIEQGLMPKMDIAIGIKEDIDIPSNLREQYSIVGTKTLLETVIDDYKHVTHWLAYFTTKDELEQSVSELRKLFPEFKILRAYHGLDNTDEVISEFETSRQPVILMTVSMFLEGMHLKNVGGVLLYRNIQKGHTYAQILGRLCIIGQKYTPVIVDVTGSIMSIKQFYVPKSSRASSTQRKKYSRKDIFDVTSKYYKLLDVLSEFVVERRRFTEDEDEFIIEQYCSKGPDFCAEALDRSRQSIISRASKLGCSNIVRWTEEEDTILKTYYPIEGTKAFIRLINRSALQCRHRVESLKLQAPSRSWTDEEILVMQTYYCVEGTDVIKRLPGRTVNGVLSKAHLLGLRCEKSNYEPNYWTESELHILKEYYPIEGPNVESRLLGRSRQNIMSKAHTMGLSAPVGKYDVWTEEKIERLKELYPVIGKKAFEEFPEYPEHVLKRKVSELDLMSPRIWTDDEVEILVQKFPIVGEDIVQYIPRHDLSSCIAKARKLKLIPDTRNFWTEEELNILKEYYPNEGEKCFTRLPGRTKGQCKSMISRLGLKTGYYSLNPWSNEEDTVIIKYYPLEGSNVYKRLTGRTREACLARAKTLRVRFSK